MRSSHSTSLLKLALQGAVVNVYRLHRSCQPVQRPDRHCLRSKKIIDLPLNARNIVGLLSLHPGVTLSDKTGEFDRDEGAQVNGARNDQQNIALDGININQQKRGGALEGALPATLDSVQEFIVQTAGFGEGAGRGSGAQVQLVTRSGSNCPAHRRHSPTEATAPTHVLLY